MITKVSTKNMSREEWLELRRNTIGGSDAGAICGMNPFSSPYSVYADKLKLVPPRPDNEAMRQGRDFEQYVAERFCEETGKRVKRDNHIIYNSVYPFAHADLDRVIVGENAGLECKTASPLNNPIYSDGSYPDHYYVQCQHYMMVTGKAKWYLAVLVYQRGLYIFEIERNEDDIAVLAELEKLFYENNILGKTEPPPGGEKATSEAISSIYTQSVSGTETDLSPFSSEIELYINLKQQKQEIEALMDEQINKIKVYMGSSEKGLCGDHRVNWKTQERSIFDKKRFEQEHPEIDISEYTKKSITRPFKIT